MTSCPVAAKLACPKDVNAHCPRLHTDRRKSLVILLVKGSAIMFVPSTHRICPQDLCISSFRIATSMAVLLSSTWV